MNQILPNPMNRISLFLLFLFFLVGGSLSAQSHVGLKAGANIGASYGSPEEFGEDEIESIDPGFGYQFGVTAHQQLTEAFGLRAELLYETRRGVKDIDFTLAPVPGVPNLTVRTQIELENRFDYLSLPILATFGRGLTNFYVGPTFSYLLAARADRTTTTTVTPEEAAGTNGLPENGTTSNEIDYVEDFEDSFINRFNMAATAGVWIGLSDGVAIDVRLFHTLLDITNNDEDRSIIDRATGVTPPRLRDDSDHSGGVQLSLVFNF
jgi:hypothetical protein